MRRKSLLFSFAFLIVSGMFIVCSIHAQTTFPTPAPPSTSAGGIIVRGQEYTAVGYDYSSILETGQGFQNCVFDPSTGYLYVIDNNNADQGGDVGYTDQIMAIDPADGRILSGFNLPNAAGSLYSYCLTMGGNGHLLFAERGGSPIYEITTGGTVAGEFAIEAIPPASWPGVQRDGMAYNPNTNTYYITEGNFSRVTRDTDGNFIRYESYDTKSYGCIFPKGIVYEANNNTLLIIDDSSDQVWEFGLDGTYIAGGGSETRSLNMPEYFNQPNGIAFDSATGRIFLTGRDTRDQGRAICTVLTPVEPIIPEITADLDHNSAVNFDDYTILMECRNQPASCNPEADLDEDGRITVLDARKLILSCDRRRCATQECFSFSNDAPSLDISRQMTQVSVQSFFEYTAGPDHSTSITFDLYLDGSLFAHVGPVPVGGTSGPIALPAQVGVRTVELRNVACSPGVGSCYDGTVSSWGGTVCITP